MGATANHHFVPQGYLRNFATGKGRQATAFTVDLVAKGSFHARVRDVASRRYFNRLKTADVDPNDLEEHYARMEAQMVPAVIEAAEAMRFTSDDNFTEVMGLITLLSSRHPRIRNSIEQFHVDISERIMSMTLHTKERYEHSIKAMQRDGIAPKRDVSYEEAKAFHDNKNYTVSVDQTYLISHELQLFEKMLPVIASRNWSFISAAEGSQFITSDNPAVLTWAVNDKGPYPPGHGLPGTMLWFPLTPSIALMGKFEDPPNEYRQGKFQVAAANGLVASRTYKQIYAYDDQFPIAWGEERLRGCDVVQWLRTRDP